MQDGGGSETASRDLTIPQQHLELLQGARGLLSARSRAINQSWVRRERKRTSMDPAEVMSNCADGEARESMNVKRDFTLSGRRAAFAWVFRLKIISFQFSFPLIKQTGTLLFALAYVAPDSTPRQSPSGEAQPCRDSSQMPCFQKEMLLQDMTQTNLTLITLIWPQRGHLQRALLQS